MLSGPVTETLVAESATADSVVVGSRGLGGFRGMILGSTSLALAGHAAGPVVVVREHGAERNGEIVVGYDGSEHAAAAIMEYAIQQAHARGVQLRVLYGWCLPPPAPYASGYVPADEGFQEAAREAAERVVPFREKNPDVRIVDEQVCDHPVAALMKSAAMADLVVVGSRGHGGPASAVLGSVSHGVLHHVTRPVAVVRPRPTKD
ncbi:hypothetical protein GCM10010149_37100 [Nonomuraea roseoviolacea subsp. roseoviolacea]